MARSQRRGSHAHTGDSEATQASAEELEVFNRLTCQHDTTLQQVRESCTEVMRADEQMGTAKVAVNRHRLLKSKRWCDLRRQCATDPQWNAARRYIFHCRGIFPAYNEVGRVTGPYRTEMTKSHDDCKLMQRLLEVFSNDWPLLQDQFQQIHVTSWKTFAAYVKKVSSAIGCMPLLADRAASFVQLWSSFNKQPEAVVSSEEDDATAPVAGTSEDNITEDVGNEEEGADDDKASGHAHPRAPERDHERAVGACGGFHADLASLSVRDDSNADSPSDSGESSESTSSSQPDILCADLSSDNYYTRLGLMPDATPAQIKTAFRKLLLQHHPDKFHGDAAKEEQAKHNTQQLTEAYAVLSDEDKRRGYDSPESMHEEEDEEGDEHDKADEEDLDDSEDEESQDSGNEGYASDPSYSESEEFYNSDSDVDSVTDSVATEGVTEVNVEDCSADPCVLEMFSDQLDVTDVIRMAQQVLQYISTERSRQAPTEETVRTKRSAEWFAHRFQSFLASVSTMTDTQLEFDTLKQVLLNNSSVGGATDVDERQDRKRQKTSDA